LIVAAAALLGLVVGSFLNVVIHRVPRRRSVAWPPSSCPTCGEPIHPYDNVPLLSYLVLGGRCRGCKAPIPARYPAVEALTGALFGAAVLQFGWGWDLLRALVLIAALVALAATDLEHHLLPNAVVGPAAFAGLVLSTLADPASWWAYPISGVAIASLLFALVFAYPRGMGMGDVKMGGMLGVFLGPYAALAVFAGAVLGTLAWALLVAVGTMRRRDALPFGLFLALGALLVLFLGPELWTAYANLVGI
jgi:leader peptidase (prepilin peptidase) / N-methyltransferase